MASARWIFTMFAVALAASVQAQDWKGTGRMEGRVLDDSGAPLEGVAIKAALPERGGETTLKTDKKGHWVLGGIAAGKWDFDFALSGYMTKKISVNLPAESSRIAPVEVRLTKAAPTGPSAEVKAALDKAETAFQERRFADARAEFEKLLEALPGQAATIHQRIGLCYYGEKNYKEALPHLEQALAADPSNVPIRAATAQAALGAGMIDRGRELLAGVDENSVKDPDTFFNIALDFLGAGKAEDAVTYFTKALTLDPKDLDAHYQRGLCYLHLGKVDEARADFKAIVEASPQSDQAALAKKALEMLK